MNSAAKKALSEMKKMARGATAERYKKKLAAKSQDPECKVGTTDESAIDEPDPHSVAGDEGFGDQDESDELPSVVIAVKHAPFKKKKK